jgi:hypothetical protein
LAGAKIQYPKQWQDKAINFGLMFVLILPAGHTVTDPDPRPREAKEFDGRIALYWKPDLNADRIWWRLQPLAGEPAAAVAALNGLHAAADPPPLPEPALAAALYDLLIDRFDLEELRTLCLKLGIDEGKFDGNGESTFVRKMIGYFDRQGELPRLLAALRAERPQQVWPAG